jgi:hypothetical protein
VPAKVALRKKGGGFSAQQKRSPEKGARKEKEKKKPNGPDDAEADAGHRREADPQE